MQTCFIRVYTKKNGDGKTVSIASLSYQMEENTSTNSGESNASSGDYTMDFSVNLLCIQPVADPFANNSTAE